MTLAREARDNRPHIKPVEKVRLSEEHTGRRAIAAALFLLIGAGALVYALVHVFTPEAGWQIIQAGTSEGATCGDDFTFLYELGAGEQARAVESRALTRLYTQSCRTAFQLFHTEERFEGVVNLREISLRPNEALEVDAVLYHAFEAVRAAGDRTVYLGPVYARYDDLFSCQDDAQLVDFDPRLNPDVGAEYAAIAAYAGDPAHIEVELLGENRLCLRVSEEYLAYARREGIDQFLDFGWMKNAFIVDVLADALVRAGYTRGCVTSFDGFARCLDSREVGYGLNLLDWLGDRPIQAGTLEYQGPMSLVSLRAFPAGEGDERRFYRLRSGEVRTLYLDPEDGTCKLDADSVTCYSPEHSCAELAMAIGRAYIADAFRLDPQIELIRQGAVIIKCWSEERLISTIGPFGLDTAITNLYENEDVRYTVDSISQIK